MSQTFRSKLIYLVGFVVLGSLFYTARPANAGYAPGEIPSCYAANQIQPFGSLYNKLFVVMIDQTVLLDSTLQKQVMQSINMMIQPGTRFVVGQFSAFSQGRYLNVLSSGVSELPIPASQVGNVPIDEVETFNRCLRDQLNFARTAAEKSAYTIMQASVSSLDQSDILIAMKQISLPIKQDSATQKVMLVVTDGLENSTVTSFYTHGMARNVDPVAEMQKTASAGMVGDFGAAKIYVIGGAMEPPTIAGSKAARDGYRNPQLLKHLQDFWYEYFKASEATLVEFGAPAMVTDIGY